ncbi:MAG: hypothetical protein K2Z80_20930 [Xanthobacteraceae bacterium]|nr:hypothetical protein [Xanthobacteraceae bacterium]
MANLIVAADIGLCEVAKMCAQATFSSDVISVRAGLRRNERPLPSSAPSFGFGFNDVIATNADEGRMRFPNKSKGPLESPAFFAAPGTPQLRLE